MFSRSHPHEAAVVRDIVGRHFPHLIGHPLQKVERGISNIKYMLDADPQAYLIKVFVGRRHRRRARTEFDALSLLNAGSIVPVPEPVACTDPTDPQPFSYVAMTKVDGVALDEVIHSLTKPEVVSLGAQVGLLLSRLHTVPVPAGASWVPSATDVITDERAVRRAQDAGVLDQEQATRFVELRAACQASARLVLLHGDLGWENIMVESHPQVRVTALIDLEHSAIGAAPRDFVKASVASGELAKAFMDALTAGYAQAATGTLRGLDDLRHDIAVAELGADLSVAMDLAGDPFRSVFALATTEHQAWRQVSRLYRALGLRPDGAPMLSGLSGTEVATRTQRVALGSPCAVRQVGALIVGADGTEIARSVNEIRPAGLPCWCERDGVGTERPRCPATHAEVNVITAALAQGRELSGTTLLCSTCPCLDCARWIVRSGVTEVCYVEEYIDSKGLDHLLASGVDVRRVTASEPAPRLQ